MTIEISNYTISGQPPESGKESKTGETQLRGNEATQETGPATTNLTAKENASRCNITDTARLLQQLEEAISSKPVVDAERVAEIQAKIKNGDLAILRTNTESQLASAESIANKILALGAELATGTVTNLFEKF